MFEVNLRGKYFITMRTTRIISFSLAILLISFQGISQGLFNNGSARGAGLLSGQLPDNARFSLELGTGFSSFSSGAGMMENYISPTVEFDVSPSFTLVAGGSFSFNQYSNLPQSVVVNNNSISSRQGMTDHSLFVAGKYMISENLFMTGTVYREEGNLPMLMMNPGNMNHGIMDYKNQGMSMGIQYRISDNLHFGAEVGVNRTNNPYQFYSPFSGPFGNRPGYHRTSPF